MSAPNLVEKLASAMAAMGECRKRGWSGSYPFATESDVAVAVRGALASRGVMLIPTTERIEWRDGSDGGRIATVWVRYTLTDGVEKIDSVFVGEGEDRGDKAVYKAYTGAHKHFLIKTFSLATGSEDADPDSIDKNEVPAQGPPTVPAAPKPKRASRKQAEEEAARTVVSPPPNVNEEKARAASLVSMVSEGGGSLRARAARLWASAERLGWGQEQFRHFAKSASGSEAPSNEWTETDLVRIEAAMAKEGGEDVPF